MCGRRLSFITLGAEVPSSYNLCAVRTLNPSVLTPSLFFLSFYVWGIVLSEQNSHNKKEKVAQNESITTVFDNSPQKLVVVLILDHLSSGISLKP